MLTRPEGLIERPAGCPYAGGSSAPAMNEGSRMKAEFAILMVIVVVGTIRALALAWHLLAGLL